MLLPHAYTSYPPADSELEPRLCSVPDSLGAVAFSGLIVAGPAGLVLFPVLFGAEQPSATGALLEGPEPEIVPGHEVNLEVLSLPTASVHLPPAALGVDPGFRAAEALAA